MNGIKDLVWTKTDDEDPYYIFSINGEKLAVVYFIGGHVERYDEWIIKYKGEQHCYNSTYSLESAMREVEYYYGVTQ